METLIESKICSKCGEKKGLEVYSIHSGTRRRSDCKKCRSISDKEYRDKNRNVLNEQKRGYYKKNKEHLIEYQKKYYSENQDYVKNRNIELYNKTKKENKEKTLEKERLNPEKLIICKKCEESKNYSDFDFISWGRRKKICKECDGKRFNNKLTQTLEDERLNQNKTIFCLKCENEFQFDKFPLKHGVRGNVCNECNKIRQTEYTKRNSEKTLLRTLEEEKNNPTKVIECKKCKEVKSYVYYSIHPFGTRRNVCKVCVGINKKKYEEEHLEETLKYRQQWRDENPEKISEGHRRYKKQLKKPQKPKWVDENVIKNIYKKMNRLNKESGYSKYDVDHIIPLNGDIVCGLHVENNLRIISHKENTEKSNKFISCSDSKLPPNEIELDPLLLVDL